MKLFVGDLIGPFRPLLHSAPREKRIRFHASCAMIFG